MANELDEVTSSQNTQGRDVNVVDKQLPVTVGTGTKVFEVLLWVCGIIPGLIFQLVKVNAGKYLSQLQQKIQHDASQIDNYLEQRVVILSNCAAILQKSIELDKETFSQIAAYRSGGAPSDDNGRNTMASNLDSAGRNISLVVEQYPELKAHADIQTAMAQNAYLQKEITAAREIYNDAIFAWNSAIYEWPAKQIVAAKRGYTTRIPFIASAETKEKARSVMF